MKARRNGGEDMDTSVLTMTMIFPGLRLKQETVNDSTTPCPFLKFLCASDNEQPFNWKVYQHLQLYVTIRVLSDIVNCSALRGADDHFPGMFSVSSSMWNKY